MLLEPGLKQELSDRKTFRSLQEVVLVSTLNFPIYLLYYIHLSFENKEN